MNGEVEWFTPGPPLVPFSPTVPGSGVPTEVEIATTAARIQQLREPREANSAYQATEYRRIRVQIPFSDIALNIQKGVRGRITDGGKDPNLVGIILTVSDARNSSWAALRTVECLTEATNA